jgi:hypothetical protein
MVTTSMEMVSMNMPRNRNNTTTERRNACLVRRSQAGEQNVQPDMAPFSCGSRQAEKQDHGQAGFRQLEDAGYGIVQDSGGQHVHAPQKGKGQKDQGPNSRGHPDRQRERFVESIYPG